MKTASRISVLLLLAAASTLSAIALFHFSEQRMRYHNNFIRRFPPHMADQLNRVELKFNSYYFAGSGDGKIFLGNSTAPFLVTVLDTAFQDMEKYKIQIDIPLKRMNSPQLQVAPPFFYFYEGASPFIASGSIQDWKATVRVHDGKFFSQLRPIGPNKVAVRYNAPVTAENILGTVSLSEPLEIRLAPGLLNRQLDGVFDTDGLLLGDAKANRLHYVYFYRNTFVTADSGLHKIQEGKTIDTVSRPDIELVKVKSKNMRTLARPPLLVNRLAATDKGWLFINSQMMGQLDREAMWKSSSIIDSYEIQTGAYLGSFYLADENGQKIRNFLISGNNAYVLVENQLIRYKLRRFLAEPGR